MLKGAYTSWDGQSDTCDTLKAKSPLKQVTWWALVHSTGMLMKVGAVAVLVPVFTADILTEQIVLHRGCQSTTSIIVSHYSSSKQANAKTSLIVMLHVMRLQAMLTPVHSVIDGSVTS